VGRQSVRKIGAHGGLLFSLLHESCEEREKSGCLHPMQFPRWRQRLSVVGILQANRVPPVRSRGREFRRYVCGPWAGTGTEGRREPNTLAAPRTEGNFKLGCLISGTRRRDKHAHVGQSLGDGTLWRWTPAVYLPLDTDQPSP
jgi:hypothetical protein